MVEGKLRSSLNLWVTLFCSVLLSLQALFPLLSDLIFLRMADAIIGANLSWRILVADTIGANADDDNVRSVL